MSRLCGISFLRGQGHFTYCKWHIHVKIFSLDRNLLKPMWNFWMGTKAKTILGQRQELVGRLPWIPAQFQWIPVYCKLSSYRLIIQKQPWKLIQINWPVVNLSQTWPLDPPAFEDGDNEIKLHKHPIISSKYYQFGFGFAFRHLKMCQMLFSKGFFSKQRNTLL